MRIGFTPGDRLYWTNAAGPWHGYRGTPEAFGAYLDRLAAAEGATDVVMLGDGRPYHRAAIDTLRARADTITPWVVEHGYLRPGFIRVETWGADGRSAIPDVPVGDDAPPLPDATPAPASFLRYAAMDIAYHAANVTLGPMFYPSYRHYALDSPWAEWRGWIGKWAASIARARQTRRSMARLRDSSGPVFLVPLQLDSDFQLRDHGTGRPQALELQDILASFAAHAPAHARLAVKEHPLDNGLRRWDRRTREIAQRLGIGGRIDVLFGGRVEDLLPDLAGVVTINSTVGLSAVLAGCPVKVLGRAIYDRPGLTHQNGLAAFWCDAERPDPDVANRFRRVLRYHHHVPGAFDGPDAITGAANLARFIAGERPI